MGSSQLEEFSFGSYRVGGRGGYRLPRGDNEPEDRRYEMVGLIRDLLLNLTILRE